MRLLKVGLILLALLLIIFATLPLIISTKMGQKSLFKIVNSSSSKNIQASSIALHWFDSQRIENLVVTDAKKGFVLHCKEIESSAPLWRILFQKNVGSMEIIEPKLELLELPEELSSLPHLFSEHSQKKRSKKRSMQPPFKGEIVIKKGSFSIKAEHFEEISADLSFPLKKGESCYARISGSTAQDHISGEFFLEGELSVDAERGLLKAQLLNFPVKGVDQLIALFRPEFSSLFTEAIGPSFNLELNAKKEADKASLSLKATSTYLQAEIYALSQEDALMLTEPAKITFICTPSLTARLLPLSLDQPITTELTIPYFSAPLNELSQTAFEAHFSLSSPQSSSFLPLNGTAYGQWKARGLALSLAVNSPSLNSERIDLSLEREISLTAPASISYRPPSSHISDALPLDIPLVTLSLSHFSAPIDDLSKMQAQGTFTLPSLGDIHFKTNHLTNIALQMEGEHVQGTLYGSYKEERFSLTKPLVMTGTLPSESLQTLLAERVLVSRPVEFALRLEPLSFSPTQPLLPQLIGKGEMKIVELALMNAALKREMILNNLNLQFQIDAKKGMLFSSLSASAEGDAKRSIDLTLAADQLLFKERIETGQATFAIHLDLRRCSTLLLETWFNSPLEGSLGPLIDLSMSATSLPSQLSLTLNAKSQSLNADLALVIKEGMLELQKIKRSQKIEFSLNREGYQWLSKLLPQAALFELDRESLVNCDLASLRWPVKLHERLPSFQHTMQDIEMRGELSVNALSLREKGTANQATLHKMRLLFNKGNADNPITFNLQADLTSQIEKLNTIVSSKEGKIAVDGQLENLFSKEGNFSSDALKIQINASFHHFPTLFLDLFTPTLSWSKLFGTTFNATLEADLLNLGGFLTLNLNSPGSRFSMKGEIVNGTLSLSEPLYAQLIMTPGLSSLLLGEANPLSISHLSALNPLTLEIDPRGFSLPLFPFELSNLAVPYARLELGQLTCRNQGNLTVVLGLLRSKLFSKEKNLKLWFAPMDLHIKNGVVDMERTEILVSETFDIALWGKIDFLNNYVDMILGLTSDCLSKAFGIKNLPKNYVLQLPMKGSGDRVEINKTKATAKIAALLAWQQKNLSGAFKGKGPAGAILGDLLGAIGVLPDLDAPSPPPKHPFPWEVKAAEKDQKKKSSDKKAEIKPKDKPLKQLLKVLRD
jgi:hypothetical protein